MKNSFFVICLVILASSCSTNISHQKLSDLKTPISTNFNMKKLGNYINLEAYPPINVSFKYYDKNDSESTLENTSNYDVIIEAVLYYDYNIAQKLDSSCHCLLEKTCDEKDSSIQNNTYMNFINSSINYMPKGTFEFDWLSKELRNKIKARNGMNCSDRRFKINMNQFIGFIPIDDRIILKCTKSTSEY